MAESSGRNFNGRERNRWHDLTIYRTAAGRYVISIDYRTQWQGETEHNLVDQAATPAAAVEIIRSYNPIEHVEGFPSGDHFAAKQATLLTDLRRRYNQQMSEILASSQEFAERID